VRDDSRLERRGTRFVADQVTVLRSYLAES
jgi:hypothetical protein